MSKSIRNMPVTTRKQHKNIFLRAMSLIDNQKLQINQAKYLSSFVVAK